MEKRDIKVNKNFGYIFLEEFKAYFNSPIAYIVIVLFLGITGWLFFSSFFLNNQAELRDFFNLLPFIFAFSIPAITMRLFSEEKNIGSYEILITLPVSFITIIIGKFLAALLFIIIMLAPTLSYAICISFIGSLDWGPVTGGYAGALFLGGAFCAIGIFTSSITKHQIIAFIIGFVICFILTIIDKVLFFIPKSTIGVFNYLSADFHFQNISRGIIDSRDIVYFISVIFVALYGINLTMKESFEKKSKISKYGKFGIYMIIVVLINIVGLNLFSSLRLDLTANKVYSLSDISKRVVSTLKEPLTIRVFFSKDLPSPHNNTERFLNDLLEEYALAGNKYFNYTFYNVSAKEDTISAKIKENQEMANNYGIYPVQIQVVEEDEVKFHNAFMGMVLIHGDVVVTIPSITTVDGLEFEITSAIQKMNNKISALLNVDGQIDVKLFLSSTLKIIGPYINIGDVPGIQDTIKEAIKNLNKKNNNKLKLSILDPAINPRVEAEAEKYNAVKLNWKAFTDSQGNFIGEGKSHIGMVIEYKDKAAELQILNPVNIPPFGKQYQLAEKEQIEEKAGILIENLLNINTGIGYITSHDTLSLKGDPSHGMIPGMEQDEESITNFITLINKSYSIKEVNLEEDGIPDGLECLLIAGPKGKFSDYDLFQIDQYLMKGHSIALFMDSFIEIQIQEQGLYGQEPQYSPNDTGLDKLLNHYGIGIKKSYLLDENCFEAEISEEFGGGKTPLYFAPVITNQNINNDLNYLNNIRGFIMLKNSPLELYEDTLKKNNIKSTLLFSSSADAWETKGQITLHPRLIVVPEDDKKSQMPLAYILEGNFPSYFAGKEIPVKEDKTISSNESYVDTSEITEKGEIISRGREGKIFVVGSSGILRNNLIDNRGKEPNAVLVMNIIDYLNNNTANAVMRSKTQKFNPLNETSAVVKGFIKIFNIAVLPVIIIVLGLFIWLKRISKKRKIQSIFQK
ncbi:MAG: Gldg family protein [Spirochaetales bacterium]|nr:Gldg family protein [Spirochaetales bacterium]